MGADAFTTWSCGRSAEEAFSAAKERALYDHGHSGYTGTVGEKKDFIVFTEFSGDRAAVLNYIEGCFDKSDHRINDKWGPAGCICIDQGRENDEREFVFFGWANS